MTAVDEGLFVVSEPDAQTWAPVTFYELPTGEHVHALRRPRDAEGPLSDAQLDRQLSDLPDGGRRPVRRQPLRQKRNKRVTNLDAHGAVLDGVRDDGTAEPLRMGSPRRVSTLAELDPCRLRPGGRSTAAVVKEP